MKKVISVKLLPTLEQAESLKKTTALFKDACNFLSEKAFESKKYNKVILHRLCYKLCKEKFPAFSSQLIVRAIGVVCDSYRLQQKEQTHFSRDTAVYDARILTWRENEASIWTVDGRFHIPIEVWNMELFNLPKGQSDLICKNGKWFLQTTVTTPEVPKIEPTKWLGVDLGVVNIAVTSDGEIFSGEKIEKARVKYFKYRQRLQTRCSQSSRRRLRKHGHKEARFRANINHIISKKIVSKAEGTSACCGIALEKLTHINRRATVKREQRNQRLSWSFAQLRSYIEYKAAVKGIPVALVSAANTSRGCSACGYVDKANRKNQSDFVCLKCGFELNADYNAAINISRRAAVNQPIVWPKM
jgi:IS605 OrfB family transposase